MGLNVIAYPNSVAKAISFKIDIVAGQLQLFGKRNGMDNSAGNRSHIGLSNVKDRIYYLCKGKIEIETAPGKGCVTTVVIPKYEEGDVEKC